MFSSFERGSGCGWNFIFSLTAIPTQYPCVSFSLCTQLHGASAVFTILVIASIKICRYRQTRFLESRISRVTRSESLFPLVVLLSFGKGPAISRIEDRYKTEELSSKSATRKKRSALPIDDGRPSVENEWPRPTTCVDNLSFGRWSIDLSPVFATRGSSRHWVG